MSRISDRMVLSIALIATLVGALDGYISREWDLMVVFLLVAAVQLILWLRQRASRVPVALRSDLAHWLQHRAEVTGDSFDDMIDRAVAHYKHGLYVESTDE